MGHPIRDATERSPYGALTREQFHQKHRILHKDAFITNKHNMRIYTQSWQPQDAETPIAGVLGMIHGYSSESGWLSELNAVAVARAGFFVAALDLQGHGYSDGPRDHIADIEPLLEDCLQYFDAVRSSYPKLPHFLYGESLGAAIAILIGLKQKTAWRGLVLSGAMCEVSRKFKPIWPLEKFLPAAAFVAPNWRVAVTAPPVSRSYREAWKRKLAEASQNRRTCGRPTAATALQLLRVCDYIQRNCADLEVPMLILHGGDDAICDPEGAKYLYDTAASKDKTLKIFEGAWHQLIGEPDEIAERAFDTMLTWMEVRAGLPIAS